MIQTLEPVDNLRALARAKARAFYTKSVTLAKLQDALDEGWELVRRGKTAARVRKQKAGRERLSDRIWSLLYRIGVLNLTGESDSKDNMCEIIAVDNEISLAVSCLSNEDFGKPENFKERVESLMAVRDQLSKAVPRLYPAEFKRNNVLCVFIENVDLSDDEKNFAESRGISVFDESDLEYYEKLVDHLGPAAKYQFFADLLPGKTIPGLTIRVPAVRTRMGPQSCLTFPISPEYLLKIAYVSHRSKGKASDVHTYQRMLKKSRLGKIREYISERGVFPTNIVVNIDKKYISFERVHQESSQGSSGVGGVLGWLTIRPAYKAAWVIDGQHRLFAYSGHEYARTGHLSVLAFEGITTSAQAKLFVDINAKQKSVKPSLLQELFSELHWDAESPSVRVQAIISKAVQTLDAERGSPFKDRIQSADAAKDSTRCISLASLYRALERHDFFIGHEEHGEVIKPGPFWAGTSEKTLLRTVFFVKKWFAEITDPAIEWWSLGSAPGGGFAMNDSVVACINVLWSVLDHLQNNQSISLAKFDQNRLWLMVEPYAQALGRHFGRMSTDERQRYRDLRGSQGQTVRTRRAQQAIRAEISAFAPIGLEEFLSREKAQTNLKGKEVIDRLEILIQQMVVDELKQEYGRDDSGWWIQAVPKAIRTEVVGRVERDDNKRQSREAYFDLIDYRTIVQGQWSLFQGLMGFGNKSGKEKQTKWLVDLNEMRRIVAHSSSGVTLTVEQLDELQEMERELVKRRKSIPQGLDKNVHDESD